MTASVLASVVAASGLTTLAGVLTSPHVAAITLPIVGASSKPPPDSISTVYGNGDPHTLNPGPMVEDGAGNIFVADLTENVIRKITPNGSESVFAGQLAQWGVSGDGGPASSATFGEVVGLAFDSAGNLFVADSAGNRIRKIDTTGVIRTVVGDGVAANTGDGGPASAAEINGPTFLAIDGSDDLFITTSSSVRKVSHGIIATIVGNYVDYISADRAGSLYMGVRNSGNTRAGIERLDVNGNLTFVMPENPLGFSGDGGPASAGQLAWASSVTVDPLGNVVIGDTYNNRVRMIDASGTISTIVGTGPTGSSNGSYGGDGGPATSAHIYDPVYLIIEANGSLLIADSGNFRIRRVYAPWFGPAGGALTVGENLPTGNPSLMCACSQAFVGGPVNTATGEFSTSTADLSVHGRGPALGMVRSYNSFASPTNGPLGYGWTFNYGMSLTLDPSTGAVLVNQENGSQVTYALRNGLYVPPPRVIGTLTKNADGTFTFVRARAAPSRFHPLASFKRYAISMATRPRSPTPTANFCRQPTPADAHSPSAGSDPV